MALLKTTTAFCPECGRSIKVGTRLVEGQLIQCTACRAGLEVISLQPLELDLTLDALGKRDKNHAKRRPRFKNGWDEYEFQLE